MSEPRPLHWLAMAMLLGLGYVVVWWINLPAGDRQARLLHVASVETARILPPPGLLAQPRWLVQHRLVLLQGMASVLAVAWLIGLCEGAERRRQDPLGGYRQTWWVSGLLVSALVVLSAGSYLVVPWPLPMQWVALAGMGFALAGGFGLGWGRPLIP